MHRASVEPSVETEDACSIVVWAAANTARKLGTRVRVVAPRAPRVVREAREEAAAAGVPVDVKLHAVTVALRFGERPRDRD